MISRTLRSFRDFTIFVGMKGIDYIYPKEDVKPIEVGDGYRDYWLSDVVKSYGGFVKFARIGYERRDGHARCEVKLSKKGGDDSAFFWHGNMESAGAINSEAAEFLLSGTRYFTDLRLRYYACCPPAVVAARHVWDYEAEHTHEDTFVDFLTGKHHRTVTPK